MAERPVHEVRIGTIKCAIWKNETEKGTRYGATFSRVYHDGNSWHSTDSFGRSDLLLLAKVADAAHTWMYEHGQSEKMSAEKAPERAVAS